MNRSRPVVLAITGASGAVYGARLLQVLLSLKANVHLTISDSGAAVTKQELGVVLDLTNPNIASLLHASNQFLNLQSDDPIAAAATEAMPKQLLVHHYKNYFTPIASGSFLTAGMVICPCSGSTLSGIAHAANQNLIQRAAEVHMKEHRKLIVVPRETPLSVIQIENMRRLAEAGVVVLPAAPGFYHGVKRLLDFVDFIVARILDQLGFEHQLMQRWSEEST